MVNEKFTSYKHLSYNNNQRFKREVRGVVNSSFFQDFHESDLNHTSKSRNDMNSQPGQGEIHINNRCIDELEIDLSKEDLEMQSDDVVFFQQLKVSLNSLTSKLMKIIVGIFRLMLCHVFYCCFEIMVFIWIATRSGMTREIAISLKKYSLMIFAL